jgi:hypothetical protein
MAVVLLYVFTQRLPSNGGAYRAVYFLYSNTSPFSSAQADSELYNVEYSVMSTGMVRFKTAHHSVVKLRVS